MEKCHWKDYTGVGEEWAVAMELQENMRAICTLWIFYILNG